MGCGPPCAGHHRRRSQAAGIAAEPKQDAEAEAELKRNFQLAGQLGATGTPLFVVGDAVLNGAVGYDALKSAVDKARKRELSWLLWRRAGYTRVPPA